MKEHQVLLKRLASIVQELALQPGEKLPPERILAPQLGISRNTLRKFLHKLEACKLVSIRQGSGTFLYTRFLELAEEPFPQEHTFDKQFADRCEAAYLLFPIVAAQSADRIGARLMESLQQCNVSLSRSLISGESSEILDDVQSFFSLLAQGTGNDYLVSMVEQVCVYSLSLDTFFNSLGRAERERLFANHVKLLHALRERNSANAAELMEEYVLFLADRAEELGSMLATDLIFKALRQRKEE